MPDLSPSNLAIHRHAEDHARETGHEVQVVEGFGWACRTCDPDIWDSMPNG